MNTRPNKKSLSCGAALLLGCLILPQSAAAKTRIDFNAAVKAQPLPEPPAKKEIVAAAVSLPQPGQLNPVIAAKASKKTTKRRSRGRKPGPQSRIGAANNAARVQPASDGFINAIQKYGFTEGALYQVYASPGKVTDIALQRGEQLVGAGPVAAGDTVRWIIGDTSSGSGPNARVHILVKPTRSNLVTNLVINTNRRTYHLELRASPSTYMASVSWNYPQDELIALRKSNAAAARAAPIATGIDVTALNFGYKIKGDKPAWRPIRAYDDGIRVFVEFPENIAQGELPPIFVIGQSGQGELVNYRVSGRHLIVDRLFAAAELRLGDKKSEQKVRITRKDQKVRR